jgi:hypothetical protein
MKRIECGFNIALFIVLFMMVSSCQSIESATQLPWKFAVLCDTRGDDFDNSCKSGINDFVLSKLAAEVVNEKCEVVLVPGDMVNGWWANGSTSYSDQFSYWKESINRYIVNENDTTRVYTVRGNHEDGNSDYPPKPPYSTRPDKALKASYIEAFKQYVPDNGPNEEKYLTYSFTHRNAFFVGLDEYVNPHRVNQTWLDKQLEQDHSPFVFVFGHEPAYAINHPDCLAYYSTQRRDFWNSIGKAGGRIYFCGHDHLYDRAHILDSSGNKIYQVVIGSGGAPRANWTPPYNDGSVIGDFHNKVDVGYILVTVNDSTALVEWKAWDANLKTWVEKDHFEVYASSRGIPVSLQFWLHPHERFIKTWQDLMELGNPINESSYLVATANN